MGLATNRMTGKPFRMLTNWICSGFRPPLLLLACALSFSLPVAHCAAEAWVETDSPQLDIERNILIIPVRGTPGYYFRLEYTSDPISGPWTAAPVVNRLGEGTAIAFVPFLFLDFNEPIYARIVVTETDETNPF